MIRLVIFDLDGTLVNAYPAVSQSVNFTLRALGFSRRTHAEIKRSVGWGDRQLLAQFVGESLAGQALSIYRPHHAKALVAPGGVRFLKGAERLLDRLKREGMVLAIASNRPTRFTKIILKTLGIDRHFRMVLCADKASRPKPHPDMLWTILKAQKAPRSQALFVGDMTIDVRTGQAARVPTVAVVTGSSTAQELTALKPLRVISQIAELNSVLDHLNRNSAVENRK